MNKTPSEEIKANLDWYINEMSDREGCSRTVQLPRAKLKTLVNEYHFQIDENGDLMDVYYRGFKIIPV